MNFYFIWLWFWTIFSLISFILWWLTLVIKGFESHERYSYLPKNHYFFFNKNKCLYKNVTWAMQLLCIIFEIFIAIVCIKKVAWQYYVSLMYTEFGLKNEKAPGYLICVLNNLFLIIYFAIFCQDIKIFVNVIWKYDMYIKWGIYVNDL